MEPSAKMEESPEVWWMELFLVLRRRRKYTSTVGKEKQGARSLVACHKLVTQSGEAFCAGDRICITFSRLIMAFASDEREMTESERKSALSRRDYAATD